MTYWLGPDRLRMDTSRLSMVWLGGAGPRMVVIQHPERQYIEFTSEDLETMRRMRQGVGGGGGDVSPLRFEVTGRRETIGAWRAFEVRVTGLPHGQQGLLWLTSEIETGLFEVFARLSEVMEGIPTPAGRDSAAPQELLRYAGLAEAPGVPDGTAVRYVATEGETTTTVTVVDLQPGPFPDDTFGAPPGYEKLRMPGDQPMDPQDLHPVGDAPPPGHGAGPGGNPVIPGADQTAWPGMRHPTTSCLVAAELGTVGVKSMCRAFHPRVASGRCRRLAEHLPGGGATVGSCITSLSPMI